MTKGGSDKRRNECVPGVANIITKPVEITGSNAKYDGHAFFSLNIAIDISIPKMPTAE